MQIVVNGESFDVEISKLRELLDLLGYQQDTVVVARNSAFIPREQWDDCIIEEHDTLDVLASMVGG